MLHYLEFHTLSGRVIQPLNFKGRKYGLLSKKFVFPSAAHLREDGALPGVARLVELSGSYSDLQLEA